MGKPGRPAGGSGVNKSELIRKFYEKNPDARTKDCIESLESQGIVVSQALVAGVRSRQQGNPGNKRRGGEVRLGEVKLIKDFVSNMELSSDSAPMMMSMCDLIMEIGTIDRFRDVLNEYMNLEKVEPKSSPHTGGIDDEEEEVSEDDAEYEDVNDSDE
jgi:hypothetical protein